MSRDEQVTCVVVDDHPALVGAVCAVLEQDGIRVVSRALSAADGLSMIRDFRPTIAFVDVRIGGTSGLELVREVVRRVPETGVGLYTAYGTRALLLEALDAGARAYVLKDAPLMDLLRAARALARGETYVDPALAVDLVASEVGEWGLVPREREILRLLADGMSNEEVARQLFVSVETVRSGVRSAMAKLDADTRAEAVALAIRQGVIR